MDKVKRKRTKKNTLIWVENFDGIGAKKLIATELFFYQV